VDPLTLEYGTGSLSRNVGRNTTDLLYITSQKKADFVHLVAEAMGWRVRDRTLLGSGDNSVPHTRSKKPCGSPSILCNAPFPTAKAAAEWL